MDNTTSPSLRTDMKAVAEALQHVLGNTYRLSTTTLMYHWNVTGPNFFGLHRLFEEQYSELWAASDTIAERIRAIGYAPIPDSCERVVVPIINAQESLPSAERMIRLLLQGHYAIIEAINAAIDVAKEEDDEASTSILSDRLVAHGEQQWMLYSSQTQINA